MSDWKKFSLGDVCRFIDYRGKTPPKVKSGVPLVTAKIIKNGFIQEPQEFIAEEFYSEWMRRGIPKKGDIVFTTEAPLGEVAQIKTDKKLAFAQRVIILESNNELLCSSYLFYALRDTKLKSRIEARQSGTTVSGIKASELKKVEINLPPLETQKKIAAVLSALDDKIELNNAINKNLEEQAQSIYKKICLKAPLVPLSELIETIESGSRPKGGAETSGIPSIGAEKIDGFGRYDYSNEKFISADYFKRLKRGIVFSGDVMLYKDGAYTGKSSMALDGFPHETCAVNEHVFLLRTKDNMAQFFLYFTLRNEDVYKKIHALACGKAAQPGLNQKELMCVTSFLPEEEVIQKFESIVSPLMRTIALNALENKKLAEIRDALLPRLMSGEIDVSNVKI